LSKNRNTKLNQTIDSKYKTKIIYKNYFYYTKTIFIMQSARKRTYTTHSLQAMCTLVSSGYLIAKSGKAHTIGETLLLPCAKTLVGCLLDEKSA
jgi:hypothetical protein